MLKDRLAFGHCIEELADHFRDREITVVVSNEARGFIIGAAVAHELGVGFVPIRKEGRLPPKVHSMSYEKEYEPDVIEIRDDGIEPGDKVLLVDDLLATGGTIKANAELVEMMGGEVVGMGFLVELEYLRPRECIGDGYDIHSLIKLETTDEF